MDKAQRMLGDRLASLERQVKAQGEVIDILSMSLKAALHEHARVTSALADAIPTAMDQALQALPPHDLEAVMGKAPDISHDRAQAALRFIVPLLTHHEAISRAELGRKLRGRRAYMDEGFTQGEIGAALALLVHEGHLEVIKDKADGPSKRGRPRETYRLISN